MTNTIQLAIALLADGIRLTATVPGPGEWWIHESQDASRCHTKVLACGRATNAVAAAAVATNGLAIYWVEWRPEAVKRTKRTYEND